MARTILVPTDLQVGSLTALKAALAGSPSESMHVLLMHAMRPPDGITDLLFYAPHRAVRERCGPAFQDGLAVLRNHFGHRIASLEVRAFHGTTASAFARFVATNQVHEVHIATGYQLLLHEQAVDPMPFILKSKVRVVEHGYKQVQSAPRTATTVDNLQLLFEQ